MLLTFATATGGNAMLLTLATSIAGGVLMIALAHRLHVSAIAILLLGGVALGPEGIGWVDPQSLPEGTLGVIVSLAVGLILFEGGLTLDVKGYKAASGLIKRLLSLGVLTTWFTTAVVLYATMAGFGGMNFDFAFCLLCASLVIVTGPTVIQPLLKRIRVQQKLHTVLHWEGVLIDPIGVFIAVLCFEWYDTGHELAALTNFLVRIVWGLGIGFAGGMLIGWVLRLRLVPDDLVNPFAIGCAVATFACGEAVETETGLLAVTVAGLVVGVLGSEQLRRLREFKAEITELMIGLLFVLLASRLELDNFLRFDEYLAWAVGGVVFIVRPLNVLMSSWGQGLTWREKLFLAWVAPRGIVAASMASLVALTLAGKVQPGGLPFTEQAVFLETFTYSVIAATVLLQAPTAGLVARLLDLRRPVPKGWMIVGASILGRRIARFLQHRANVPTLLVDSNARSVATARQRGLTAVLGDAREADDLSDRDEFIDVGHVLALTDNEALNQIVCQNWADVVGPGRVYRWASESVSQSVELAPGDVVWSGLPKPSIVSLELERGDATTLHAMSMRPERRDSVLPLLAVVGDRVVPDVRGIDVEQVTAALELLRKAVYLERALTRHLVVRSAATTAEAVIDALLEAVERNHPGIPREKVRADLLDQGSLVSSHLGRAVAVPHAIVPVLDARLCAVAQLEAGADFGAPDGEPARLVFLLLSPPGDPEGHLATLAEIATLVSDEAIRGRLVEARSASELFDLLRGRVSRD